MTLTETFSAKYRRLSARIHGCPIEQGHLASLADNECRHGSLPIDKPTCECWPEVPEPRKYRPRNLPAEDVTAIRASTEFQRVLALRHGVSQTTVGRIKAGQESRAA